MKCDIEADRGPCPLCARPKEKLLFVLRSEVYNGRACAEHLHALITQAKPEKEQPQNGEPAVHESG